MTSRLFTAVEPARPRCLAGFCTDLRVPRSSVTGRYGTTPDSDRPSPPFPPRPPRPRSGGDGLGAVNRVVFHPLETRLSCMLN